ncbi:DUF559 domain-containing protein [Gordonia sp. DT101]|uniref:DUF559 domain-containing protein n=1 Tax=Gordonia sp. DT101 TaxID=3416545 RepID=UPI003CE77C23
MADETALRAMIADHDGVFTSVQAGACGVDSDGARRRVSTGEWIRVVRSVYRVSNRKLDARMRMRIAVLSAGPGSALYGSCAAWWHGLITKPSSTITVIAPHGRHGRPVDGALVWHRTVAPMDLTVVDGLTVTSIPLTVLDASVDIVVRVMDSALLREQVTLIELVDTQHRNSGRRGSARSRIMLAAMSAGARSEAERKAVAVLSSSDVSGWATNVPACGYILDLAVVEHKIAIEIDGFAFHSDAEAFQHDRERQNVLVANGWTVLRFTWHDLTERPGWVLAQIRAAIRRVTAA